MNSESQVKRFVSSWFEPAMTDEPGDWSRSRCRNLEVGFAIARALVVLSVPLLAAPGMVDSATSLSAKLLVASYSFYAAALIFVFVTIQQKPVPATVVAVHAADILWSCGFAWWMQSLRPVLLPFIFPMLTAALRWGFSET